MIMPGEPAERAVVTVISAGFSLRHWSSANGHLVLNGHPVSAGPAVARAARGAWRCSPRSASPKRSGSGADAISSWV